MASRGQGWGPCTGNQEARDLGLGPRTHSRSCWAGLSLCVSGLSFPLWQLKIIKSSRPHEVGGRTIWNNGLGGGVALVSVVSEDDGDVSTI